MTQVLERPPQKDTSNHQQFCLVAVSNTPPLYWQGRTWIAVKEAAQVFPSYKAALQEKPKATQVAPTGSSVIISEL